MPENKPKTRFPDKQIEMAHGAGGKASRRLIEGFIAPVLGGPLLDSLGDAALLDICGARRLFLSRTTGELK
ncbi:MAG: hypothetical protein H0U13_08075 [Gemmatimonadaceae bacterium]|nr:hypothetical protein [Gemmatimonadaceae bacterium]